MRPGGAEQRASAPQALASGTSQASSTASTVSRFSTLKAPIRLLPRCAAPRLLSISISSPASLALTALAQT